MMLYNLSLEQHRMVKFYDFRDLHETSVLQLLTRGPGAGRWPARPLGWRLAVK